MSKLRSDQSVGALFGDLGGSQEQSYIIPTTLDGAYEVQTVVHPAVTELGQGDFYKLTNAAGTTYAVWFDIDNNGTEPNGAIYTACSVKIQVDVVTGDTAAQVATKAKTAIDAEALFVKFTNSRNTATITFTSTLRGNIAAPASYVEAETAGPFTVDTTTAGSSPTVQGKYFTFANTTTSFYGWFSNNGAGSDPAPGGTGREIALVGNETNATYLAAIVTVIDGTTGMTAALDGDRITVKVDAVGAATDIGAGDSGFTVSIGSQGKANAGFAPGGNRGDDSVTPSLIS